MTTIKCYFSNSANNGWRNTTGRKGSLKHCIFENINHKSVQVRGDSTVIEDVRILNSVQYGIEITGNDVPYGPDYTLVKNCYISGSGINAIRIAEPTSAYQVMKEHVIEDCILKNGVIGIMANDSWHLKIRRNQFSNFSSFPIRLYTRYSDKVFYPEISYNTIFNTGPLVIENGIGAVILNNTIDGEIDLTGSSSGVVRNNYFRNLINAATFSNNLDMDTINISKHFQDYSHHNYHLKSTAFSSVSAGFNVSSAQDSGNKPDIGAYDHKAVIVEKKKNIHN
jgi:hypothetical protein